MCRFPTCPICSLEDDSNAARNRGLMNPSVCHWQTERRRRRVLAEVNARREQGSEPEFHASSIVERKLVRPTARTCRRSGGYVIGETDAAGCERPEPGALLCSVYQHIEIA